MVSLIKYGALSGGEKYNTNILEIDGLSTDTKPITTFIEYGVDGREIGRTSIENGSTFTEIDTGKLFMYDAENTVWYEIVTSGGGGGGGGEPGTTNYNDLTNKPSVNGHILIGSKTSSDLDLQPVISDLSAIRSGAALGATAVQPATMNQALSHKQDTLTFDSTPTSGSTNPVTSGGVYTSLTTKVDKVTGKDLSTNDFTNADKAQITTNKNSIAAVANRGSKNIFKNTANSKTYNGVTFNVNADGTVSTSGSATPAVAVLEIGYVTLAAGTYIVSGCPEGGAWSDGANKYRIRVAVNNSWRGDDKGNGFSVTLNEGDTVSLQINTAIGLDATGLVFKPMIRPASIEDDTFAPYAPTNRELYEMILALQSGS